MTRLSVLLISALATLNLFADPLDAWTWRNPLPTGNILRSVAYGNGQFIAVGAAGTILVSTDATNWTDRPTPTGKVLAAIAYGNGRFVAVGNADPYYPAATIVTSTDTTNWISASPATTNTLFAVGFGNGMFVAVGENQTIVTSTDGTNWTKRREVPLSGRFVCVAYGNGLFMVPGFTSPDGVTWSPKPTFGASFRSITFGNGLFIAENTYYVGPSLIPRIVTGVDGNSWSATTLPPPYSAAYVYDSTEFVIVDFDYYWQSNVVYTSASGLNWTTNHIDALPDNYLRALAFGGGQYVGISSKIMHSTNLLQWPAVGSSLPITTARVFLQGNGKSVLAGTGPILTSSNGLNYETNATTGNFGAGAFGTDTFILTTGGGSIVTSTNGSNWTARTTGGSSINALTYGSNTFIAVGGNGDIRTSANGTGWSGRFSGTTLNLNAVAYANGLFVVVGSNGGVLTSPDTISWTIQDAGTIATLRSVSFGNDVFFATGDGGTIRISSDGINWIPVDSGTSETLWSSAATRGNLLIAGGGTLLSSIDGLRWSPHRAPLGTLAVGTTLKTFVLMGVNAGVVESGELNPIGLFAPSITAPNTFHLKATGDPGTAARLQRSANLTEWTDVLTFTNSGTPIPINDSGATNSRAFYRIVSP
jgi:hypothetical protein